jgi:CBS domain-containing protein/ribosome-associated translation inhibitor RaiA
MQLGELMNPRVVTIGPDEPANAAWSEMRDRRIRHLVVTEDGKVVGVISERDLGGKADAARRRGSVVRDLMTPSPVTATPTTSLRRAATMMREGPIGSLPVMDGNELAGIVTATDVLDALGRTSADRSRRSQRSPRTPDSKVRTPFPDRLPRAYRREAGRAAAPLVPTYLRALGVELSHNDREYIRRKLGMKLGKFATAIERISVRIEDVNGPKGGVDHVCRIKVVISGHPSVFVERRAASLPAAVNAALTTVERAVRRAVQRRRPTTTRGGTGSARVRS